MNHLFVRFISFSEPVHHQSTSRFRVVDCSQIGVMMEHVDYYTPLFLITRFQGTGFVFVPAAVRLGNGVRNPRKYSREDKNKATLNLIFPFLSV